MQRWGILIQALLILLLLAVTALGETRKGDDAAVAMDEIVVTAERLQEYIKNHPRDVQSVEREEFAQRNLSTVEDILKTMPGVEVYTTAGVGSRISIRGSGKSGGVLVLLNGRPLNSNQL